MLDDGCLFLFSITLTIYIYMKRESVIKRSSRWIVLTLIALVALLLLLLYRSTRTSNTPVITPPAKVESVLGTKFQHVTLSAKAAERLGIETVLVREEWVVRSGGVRRVVPYASVIYGLQGETWVYISPEPPVFVRYLINIDYIDGGLAILLEGPPPGTSVVTVGVAELYGADTGIGK